MADQDLTDNNEDGAVDSFTAWLLEWHAWILAALTIVFVASFL